MATTRMSHAEDTMTATDPNYQIGDEITTYRPEPEEYTGLTIKPFKDKMQERQYEEWRNNMIADIYSDTGVRTSILGFVI